MRLRNELKRYPILTTAVRFSKRVMAIGRRVAKQSYSQDSDDLIASLVNISDGRQRFVGYYDHSPFNNKNEDVLLLHSINYKTWKKPSPLQSINIELINHKENKVIRVLGETSAWNWRQGARALWLNSEK